MTTRNRWYVERYVSGELHGNEGVRLTEVAAERRFQEQCFLMHWLPFFASIRQSNYTIGHHSPDVFIPILAEPTEMMNQLTGISGVRSLMSITPDIISMIQPTVRLFKVHSETINGTKHQFDAEYIFPDNITGDPYYNDRTDGNAVSKMMANRTGRGTGVGLKEFSWDFEGTNPVEQERLITANLLLRFNDFEELFMERSPVEVVSPIDEEIKKTVIPKFVDLIMRSTEDLLDSIADEDAREDVRRMIEFGTFDSDVAQAHRFYDPTHYELKAVVGWTFRPDALKGGASFPGANSLKEVSQDIRRAIEATKMVLYLTIHDHTISYREDGTIDLNVQYVAAIERDIEVNTNDLLQSTYETARQQQLEALITSLGDYENTISSPGGCSGNSTIGDTRSDESRENELEETAIYRSALERELMRLRAESKSVGYGAVWQYFRHRNQWASAGAAGRTHTVFASAAAIGAVDPDHSIVDGETGEITGDLEGANLDEFGATPGESLDTPAPAGTPRMISNSAGLFVQDTAKLREESGTAADPRNDLIPSGRNPEEFAFGAADGTGLIDSIYLGAPAPGRATAGRGAAGLGTWPSDAGGSMAGTEEQVPSSAAGETTTEGQWTGQAHEYYRNTTETQRGDTVSYRRDNLRGRDSEGGTGVGTSPIVGIMADAARLYNSENISGPTADDPGGSESEFVDAFSDHVQRETIYWTRPIRLGTENNTEAGGDPDGEDDVIVYPVQFIYYGDLLEWAIKKSLMRFEYDPNLDNNWLAAELSYNNPMGGTTNASSVTAPPALGPYVINNSWRINEPGGGVQSDTQESLSELRDRYLFAGTGLAGQHSDSATASTAWTRHLDGYKRRKASLDNLQIVLGCISYWDHPASTQRYINLADIPISLNLFSAWWMTHVVNPGKLQYHLIDFIKDTMRSLVLNIIGGADCYEDANQQLFDIGVASYTSKAVLDEEEGRLRSPLYIAVKDQLKRRANNDGGGEVPGFYIKGLQSGDYQYIASEDGRLESHGASEITKIYRASIGQLKQSLIDKGFYTESEDGKKVPDTGVITDFTFEDSDSIPIIPHLVIYARGYNVNHLRGYETSDDMVEGSQVWEATGGIGDAQRGIYHMHLGEMAGLLKSMQFYKTEQPGLAEARIAGGDIFAYSQLRGRYDVRMVMYGNTFFLPGQMIYVDPASVGTGHGVLRKMDALLLGLGGYFQIVEVSSVINSESFETEIRAIWHGSGIPGTMDRPSGTRPTCASHLEAVAYAEKVMALDSADNQGVTRNGSGELELNDSPNNTPDALDALRVNRDERSRD